VAADNSDCHFERKYFYVRVHVICFNEIVCVEKFKSQMRNTDLLLQTLYLGWRIKYFFK